jgi:hypothetical protein
VEEMLKEQEGIIDDLESKSQLYAEEIQRSRESEESFRKAIADQMEAHFEQTARRAAILEAQNVERMTAMKERMTTMMERVKESEKKIKESERNMKKLKEDNEYQEEVIVRLEKVIPALMQDMQDLREYAEETRAEAGMRVKGESHDSPFMFSKTKRQSIAR